MGAFLVIGTLVLVVVVVVAVPLIFYNNNNKTPNNNSNYQPPSGTCKRKLDCPDAKGNRNSTSSLYCDNTGSVQSITFNGGINEYIANGYFELISGANGIGCNGIFNVPTEQGEITFTISTPGNNYNTYNNTLNLYTDQKRTRKVDFTLENLDVSLNDATSTQGKCIDTK